MEIKIPDICMGEEKEWCRFFLMTEDDADWCCLYKKFLNRSYENEDSYYIVKKQCKATKFTVEEEE